MSNGEFSGGESTSSFIRDSLNPVVAVLSSYEAEVTCQKNNLTFTELLAPFNQLSSDAAIKDPSNQNHLIKNLRLDFRDLRRNGFLTNIALPLALQELVRASTVGQDEYENTNLHISPWYDQYRRQFAKLLEPSEHEFVRHYLACLFVVSTSHSDPLEQLSSLSQTQHILQHQLSNRTVNSQLHLPKHAAPPKWFSPNIFKFHLLIHDVSADDDKKAEAVYQQMKMTYGAHACHLLRINSNNPTHDETTSAPDPWASFLRNRLRNFDSVRLETTEVDAQVDDRPTNVVSSDPLGLGTTDEDVTSFDDGEVKPKKVVRSESIPHPLSSNDLTALNVDAQAPMVDIASTTKHGKCLSASDVDRLQKFVQEFCLRGLLPFVERQLKLLNDQISSRRGLISKSLVSSAKRWFTVGSSPNLPSMAPQVTGGAAGVSSPDKVPSSQLARPAVQPPAVSYTSESVEMQMRRLADLAFLFQHYELAYQHYYALKKEFTHAGAWLHQAGAAEFASLCVYLSGANSNTAYPNHYIDGALTTYSSTCGKPWLAIRATMYGAEILVSRNTSALFSEAAGMYIRMTSGDDLSGALFLERAAWCFAKAKLYRKAALHLILAGHRFRKSGLTVHMARCYELARVAYDKRSWKYAEDHINFTLGQQSSSTLIDEQKIDKMRFLCFSSEYLSNMKKSWELVNEALNRVDGDRKTKKAPKVNYVYGPKAVSQMSTTILNENDKKSKLVNTNLDLVSCRITCQATLSHDFSQSTLCFVPVQLFLFNVSPTSTLKATLKLFTGGPTSTNTKFITQMSCASPIAWTRMSVVSATLKANECQMLPLVGYATTPGVYDVGRVSVKYSLDGDSVEYEMNSPQPHFVTIRNSLTSG